MNTAFSRSAANGSSQIVIHGDTEERAKKTKERKNKRAKKIKSEKTRV